MLDLSEFVRVQLKNVRLKEQLLTGVFDLADVILAENQLLIGTGELLQGRGQLISAVRVLHDGLD